MLTFCTGNTSIKRKCFRSMDSDGAISVDNDEIIAMFTLDGKAYAVSGDIPYANMTLEQYIACNRALLTRLPLTKAAIKDMLIEAGLNVSPKKRLSKLSRVEYRAASLVAKLMPDIKTIFVNFDGLEYSKKNCRQMQHFLSIWGKEHEVFVAVSDTRFIPKRVPVLCYTSDGIVQDRAKEISKVGSIGSLKRHLRRSGMDIALPKIKKVVLLLN